MKKRNLFGLILLVVATATLAVGCGGSSEEETPGVGVHGAPTVPVPPQNGYPGSGYSTPAGNYCYWMPGNNQPTCGRCPFGMTESSPGYCTSSGGNLACPTGYTSSQWGTCVPQNFNCPAGTNFSWQYGGCVASSPVSNQYYTCRRQGYFYVCRYTYNPPYPNCYFNGWGWVY